MNFGDLTGPLVEKLELATNEFGISLEAVAHDNLLLLELDPARTQKVRHRITHRAEVTPRQGKIAYKAATALREALSLFLTFAAGRFVDAPVIRGYGSGSEPIWTFARISRAAELSLQSAWLEADSTAPLGECFSTFWQRWSEDSWVDALRRSISWYARSTRHDREPDTSIVLSYAALEVLAWARFVPRSLSEDGFRKLAKADVIRLSLAQAGIPTDVPEQMKESTKTARRHGYDGPQLIAESRNMILHPTHKKQNELRPVVAEVAALTLWYLELSMLNLIGYQGSYKSRLRALAGFNDLEPVPWFGA